VDVAKAAPLMAGLALMILASCGAAQSSTEPSPAGTSESFAIETVAAKYGAYTPERAEREGYRADRVCLDAAAFGLPPARGAMGFHSTNESLLRGPIDADRPQAFMFDVGGRVLGVEYEVLADSVKDPPRLFGRVFSKLGAHAGVQHEHYALHLWFIDNPDGRFADFNPRISCPPGSTGGARGPADTPPPDEHGHGP
jgi:hypothetical protein